MEMLSGGDILIRALQDEGVELIYGYPGGAALHIYDALFRQDKLRHILVRHEQAATHAADAYSRATGKVGTVLVTSGPGATNAITGIATAFMDSIPMVVVSGQVPTSKIGEDAFQETDMIGVSRPIVKHSFLVTDPSEIASTVKKAYYIAASGRPGPVVIDIPKDITDPEKKYEYSYPDEINIRSYSPSVHGHTGQIKKGVQLLLEAKRPIIYAGGGVIQGNASAALTELAQMLDIPVTNTLMGLGCYPGSDRQFLGMLGMHGTYEANAAMHYSDIILAVGARFDDRVTNSLDKFCPTATIVHVDIDPASISKTIKADIPIVGDVGHVLNEMLDLVKETDKRPEPTRLDDWWRLIDQWRQDYGLYTTDRFQPDDNIIKPQEVIQVLHEVTGGDAYITSDVGQHQMFAAQYYLFDQPRRWINSGGLGTMGFGLPAAMGVQFADRDANVVCVTGEGSIPICIQGLSTCEQYHLPVKIICLNNQALGMVKQSQDMNYASRYSESLYEESLPDFVKLVESFGHVGMRITNKADLKSKMQECFALKDKLVFMDIYVDPGEHVYPMQIAPGSMKDMWLSKTKRT